jgi:type 1 glutamine amidotransferase
MKVSRLTFLIVALAAYSLSSLVHAEETKKRKILFFTRSQGFEHSTIKLVAGHDKSFAQQILENLGEKNGFEVTTTKDGTYFTEEKLAPFDAIIFCTTGDLCKEGGDKQPAMPKEGKDLFLNLIKKGKGFIAMHNGADTFHSPGKREQNDESPTAYDPYISMLGGEFIRHGSQQKARITCHDKNFPGVADWAGGAEFQEEWYTFKNIASDIHVIFTIETGNMKRTDGDWMYNREPYPVTWARKVGDGRVYYTAMGHREDVWNRPEYQKLLVGAIDWVTKKVEAEIPSNLTETSPKAMELPAAPPPKPKKEEPKKEEPKKEAPKN